MVAEFDAWAQSRGIGELISADQLERLRTYVRLLATWNARINLTGFSMAGDMDEALDRLILEPVAAAAFLPDSVRSVLDVGSGGGSPALPLAVAAPHLTVTLVESHQRKCVFLREAIRAMALPSARVVAGRVEEMASSPDHGTYDAVTIRAVRLDSRLIGQLWELVRPGGFLVYFDRVGQEAPPGWPQFRLLTTRQADGAQWRLVIYQRNS